MLNVWRRLTPFVLGALFTELVDELVDGAGGAAWPLIRDDLHLSYAQIGVLLGLPALVGNLIEPGLGLLADTGHRRAVILGGGVAFVAALALTALAGSFWPLLLAFMLFYPASGAFVSLTQSAWMDAEPHRQEQNMARWTLAGSVGNVAGPLLLGATVWLGLGWRPVYLVLAALGALALLTVWRQPELRTPVAEAEEHPTLRESWANLRLAARQRSVIDALALLEASDLMLDIFRAFLALYFVDAAGTTPAQAGLVVAVLTGVGLLGDALIVPALERVSGVAFVRASAAAVGLLLAAFLLTPSLAVKVGVVAGIGLLTSGWYAVLKARLYAQMPGRSGAVMAISSVAGIVAAGIPTVLGFVADRYGVQSALWLLLAGPLLLVWRLPRAPWRRPA